VATIALIRKDGCYLCGVARGVIGQELADLPESEADDIELVEASIEDDPELYAQWWEKIPVVLIDGRLHAHWRVAPDRLRAALAEAAELVP